jgi:hypothetical protein
MRELVDVLLWLVILGFVSAAGFFVFKFRNIRREVEDALKEATTEEQEIIRNKVVKALFPPRFPRD